MTTLKRQKTHRRLQTSTFWCGGCGYSCLLFFYWTSMVMKCQQLDTHDLYVKPQQTSIPTGKCPAPAPRNHPINCNLSPVTRPPLDWADHATPCHSPLGLIGIPLRVVPAGASERGGDHGPRGHGHAGSDEAHAPQGGRRGRYHGH